MFAFTTGDGSGASSAAHGTEDLFFGVRIRRMSDGDLSRVMKLRSVVGWAAQPEAFGLLRGMKGARWAVAEEAGGDICGMVGAVSLFGGVGVLCHLAVHDEYRERGIGTRLAAWAVTYLKSRGSETVRLYTTPRAERLYRSLGFEPGAFRTVYRLERPEARPGEESGEYGVETLSFGELPELYGLDWWTYGADRSPLILATLRLHPGRGLVARDASGRMKGYLIRSSSRGATRIGPFVAADTGAARSLLARAIRTNGKEPIRLISPGGAPARDLLREFGFSGREDRLRMDLGEARSPDPRGPEQYATTAYLAT